MYINVIDRPGWRDVVCRLVRWLADYMCNELNFQILNVNEHIHRYHILEKDLVHINQIGYHRYYDAVMRPITTTYMQWMTTQMSDQQ